MKVRRRVESLEEGLKANWPDLIKYIQKELPASNGWLERAKWELNELKLVVLVESNFGLNQLKDNNCDELIKTYIKDELGYNVEVTLSVYELNLAPPPPPEFVPPSEVPSYAEDSGNYNGNYNGGENKSSNGGGRRRRRSEPEEGALLGKKVSAREKSHSIRTDF